MSAARRRGRALDGILLLDKPLALSSNQALQQARRLFDAAKAGHTGSLDPLATGLLPLCFGEATKVSQFLLDADKTYRAEVTLGVRTASGDSEGEIVATAPVPAFDVAELERAAAALRGQQMQIPPMYSALKHQGQPLHRLARRGIEVERAARAVHIERFDILAVALPRVSIEVRCSKGTYIRTLAEDFGAALGCGAHVSALRRLAAGPFSLAAAYTLDQLDALARADPDALARCLLPLDSALTDLPAWTLDASAAARLCQGQSVVVAPAPAPGAGLVRLYASDGRYLGVGSAQPDGSIVPRRLCAQEPAARPTITRLEDPQGRG